MRFPRNFFSKSKYVLVLAVLFAVIGLMTCSREEAPSTPSTEMSGETVETEILSESETCVETEVLTETESSAETEVLTETETSAETEVTAESSEIPVPEEVILPESVAPPSFLHVEEMTVKLSGLRKSYRLAWVSDLHIIADAIAIEQSTDILDYHYDTVKSRYEHFKTSDGIYSMDLWDDIVDWLNTQKLDGIILGGDMLDYYSSANIAAFKKEYDRISAPVMYIRADHDYSVGYNGDAGYLNVSINSHAEIDGDRWGSKYLDFGEFMIVGVNNSQGSISEDVWADISNHISSAKQVILATHVPYESVTDTSLYDLSMSLRGKEYYWPSETYQPFYAQPNLIEALHQPDTIFKQVLAGHLHASWNGMINSEVPEHVFGPAYAGNIGIINVVSK